MEAQLFSLSNPSPTEDQDMDGHEEKTAIFGSSKKTTGSSSFSIPSSGYFSSRTSNGALRDSHAGQNMARIRK
jgi:hypothetical protein